MKRVNKIMAVILAIAVVLGVAVVSASAVDTKKEKTAATGIKIHYYSESGQPNIYYWNSLPTNIETTYPGPKTVSEGNNWYGYTFPSNITKVNFIFVTNGEQSAELTQNTGEWWYKKNRWYNHDPSNVTQWDRTDMREDSIYFAMTTRFYDGDSSNNVHCWDDANAGNPDSDPAWRGDFKGLIDKLDYIKALGFSAIWVTPVVENASGYDYHGYHALDFSKVDAGKLEIIEEPYNFNEMLQDVVTIIEFRIRDRNLQLILDIGKNIPRELIGDANRVRQILINLLNKGS